MPVVQNPFNLPINTMKYTSLIILFFLFPLLSLHAQEDDLGTEVVNIVKPYTPTISDAFKVKETPMLNDSTNIQKKPVKYEIFSVPVASTFTPAKGKAATVEKAKPMTLYDNYATLGFGTYTTVLGELFSSFDISRTDNASIFFRHNSAQGDIKDVKLENKFYDTELRGSYHSRQKDMSYGLEAGFNHQLFNWYGIDPDVENDLDDLSVIDPQQTYFGVDLGGTIGFEESVFTKGSANLYYTGDAYGSSEIQAILKPEFEFPIADLNFRVDGLVDYLTGSFDRMYFLDTENKYSFLNAGVTPALVYFNEDLTLTLGAQAIASMDSENSETDFYIFPKINGSYRLVDELLIAYAGVEGSLDQNTYREAKEENPFVSPTLFIMPTKTLYNAFGGLKGKLSNQIGYNIRGSYGKQEDRAMFQKNPYDAFGASLEDYQYGNSFGLVYDDLNVMEIFGELQVEVSEVFSLGANVTYNSYSLDNQPEAWNLPSLQASIFSNFNITEQLYGGVSIFYVGEREDVQSITSASSVTLDSYIDANVNLGYNVTDRLSVFAKGSNLLGKNYEKWLNFPVQGIQGLLGATYKFNW